MPKDCNSNGKDGKVQSRRRKGRNRYNPRNDKFNADRVPGAKRPGRNDLSWWAKNPELLAAAARVPFAKRPGMHLEETSFSFPPIENPNDAVLRQAIPGVMSIEYAYTIGRSSDVNSPASITAKELYARVRSAFSGSLDEDAPDLFMFVIALDQIHAYIAFLKRLYRTINAYSSENYMYPEQVFNAQFPSGVHITPDVYNKFRTGKVGLWNSINTMVNMVNKFNCPKNMDIFERHRWMNEHVYSDINEVRGQSYVFTPQGFFWVDDTTATGTQLTFKPLSDIPNFGFNPVVALSEYGYDMIAALSNWDDAYTINGHIARAFEGVEFYGAALLAQDEQVQPVYNEEVLLQIHNLTVARDFVQDDIKQDPLTNAIIHQPFWLETFRVAYLDLPGSAPSAESVVLSTRLVSLAVDNKLTCGTEVVVAVNVTVPKYMALPGMTSGDPYEWMRLPMPVNASFVVPVDAQQYASLEGIKHLWGGMTSLFMMVTMLQQWNHAPRCYIGTCCGNDGNPHFTPTPEQQQLMSEALTAFTVGECDNLTTADFNTISDLNRVCLYSVFNCFNK